MSVTEKLMAPGQFNVQLDKTITPNTIINQLDAWGNIVIVPADLNVTEFSDATLLGAASYVGILYALEIGDEENVVLNGQGMVAYLGSSDSTGMPIAETGGPTGVRSYTNETLENVLDTTGTPKGLLRDESGSQGPIRKGTITETGTNYTGTHYTESALKAIKYVCQEVGAEFKISTTGLLSAGPSSSLFAGHGTDPTSIIVRNQSGEDPNITGLTTTSLVAQYDASEFVNKVELVASKYGFEANYGQATASSNPYKDIFGNPLKRTQYISDPQTPATSKTTRATAYLNELNEIKKTLNVSLEEYDIAGDFSVGDKIFIHDPDIGFVDTEADRISDSRNNLFETVYQGQILNPTKIRILGLTWPIKNGYGVFYRKSDGSYIELTDYILWETGDVQLEIGDVAPSLTESLGFSGYTLDAVGGEDKTVPNSPSNLSQVAGTYSDGNGVSKAFIKLSWTAPTNTDGSTITDGAYYRVRYKAIADSGSNNINTSAGAQVTDYTFQTVQFSDTDFVIYDLSPNTFYEVGVQAVDQSGFDSAFASISSVQTPRDASAPNKPAGFSTIASNPLRVQFIHNLGQAKDDDGNAVSPVVNFTLAKDIDHLNIYASTTSGFDLGYNSTTKKVTNSGFKIGELKASHAHITNGIATVGYIDLDNATTHFFRCTAVDSSGNESEPSDEQSGNAELVNTSHIANLAVTEAIIGNAAVTTAKIANLAVGTANIADAAITNAKINDLNATKINAGTISADRIASGSIDASKLNFTPVSGSNVVATINASSEGITIDADTLDLSGVLNVGDAINIGGSDSTSFHVDSDGNMFLGAGTIGSAPFKVTNAGVVTATNYTLTGGNINTATVTNPAITLSKNTASDVPTTASSDRLKIGDTVLFNRDISSTNYLATTKSFLVLPDGDEDNPSIAIQGTNATMGFFVNDPLSGVTQMQLTNGDDNVASWSTADDSFSVPNKLTLGGTLQAGGGTGNSGQVLASTGNGVEWISTSGHSHGNLVFPNAGTLVTNQNVSTAHGQHADGNYLTNNNHSHGNTMTPNNHNHNFGNDITGFSGNNHNHNQYLSNNHILNASNPHGINSHINSNNAHSLGNKANSADFIAHLNLYHGGSDERLKENISDTSFGLDYINSLRPVDFQFTSESADNLFNDDDPNKAKYLQTKHGFIAQEVRATTLDNHSSNNAFGGLGYKDADDNDLFDDIQTLDLQQFIGPLVKSVQQLSAKIDVMQARIDELEG
tara:strand:+ start:6159 stop:9863 length:3705 start_codon:yes stop_codon:yes gene_type:complete